MMIGLEMIFCGALMLAAPVWAMMKKFGALSDENFARFLAEMNLPQRFQLAVTVSCGCGLLLLGLSWMAMRHSLS
jgi:hypothetical protein